MRLQSIILFFCLSLAAGAQSGFQKNLSEFIDRSAFSLSPADSSYVIAGSRWGNATMYDYCATKLDENGSVLWSKTFPSSNDEYLGGLFVSPVGEMFLSGYRTDSTGDHDLSLMKLDASGTPVWHKTYGTTNMEISKFVGATPAGDFYLAGVRDNNERFCVVKTDNAGTVLWSRAFGSPAAEEEIISGTVTQDGGLVLFGALPSTKTFLVKIRPDGSIAWSYTYGSSHTQFLSSVKQTADGGFVLASSDFRCDATGCHAYCSFMKLDSTGNVSWARAVEGALGSMRDAFETSDGNFVFTGQYEYLGNFSSIVVKTNSSGTQLWTKLYSTPGTSSETLFSRELSNGAMALAGTDNALSSLFLADADGNSGCNEITISPVLSVMNYVRSTPLVLPAITETSTVEVLASSAAAFSLSDSLICEALGIDEQQKNFTVTVFPNPFSATTILEVSGDQSSVIGGEFKMYDVFGREVYRSPITDHRLLISRENLTSGIYFYEVRDGEKVIGSGKIIAE